MTLRAWLLHFLRVPREPSAPAGDADIRVFRAAPNYFRYRLVRWAMTTAGAVTGLLWGLWWLRMIPRVTGAAGGFVLSERMITMVLGIIEGAGIIGVVTHALVSLVLLRLDFEQRWYIVSDRSLRIREGLVRMHEKTMTFANVQHVAIRQGPLQRLLGIADLEVRTAGGGGGRGQTGTGTDAGEKKKDDLHVARFRGLANAERIRDAIRERLRRHVDTGLGDPDDAAPPGGARPITGESARELAGAARALAQEVALLHQRLAPGRPYRAQV
ncbi:MAG: PH domain-containing protein [Longimicrobiales bacterium]